MFICSNQHLVIHICILEGKPEMQNTISATFAYNFLRMTYKIDTHEDATMLYTFLFMSNINQSINLILHYCH